MAKQEEEKATPPVRNYLANLWRIRAWSSPAGQDGREGRDAREGIKKEKKKKGEGGERERAEKEAVSYESRTAGRRIKISVNKRLRWT